MAKAKSQTTIASSRSVAALYAGSATLNAYWIMVLIKASSDGFSSFLNWYGPVGPLLSLFILNMVVFGLVFYFVDKHFAEASQRSLKRHQNLSVQLFVLSSILVFFMLFPPIFEPIAEFFHG